MNINNSKNNNITNENSISSNSYDICEENKQNNSENINCLNLDSYFKKLK